MLTIFEQVVPLLILNRPYGKISSGLKLDHEFLTGSKTGSSYKKIVERFQKV